MDTPDTLRRLFGPPEDLAGLADQVKGLQSMVFRLIQEVDALESYVRRRGDWDEKAFRRHRIDRMLRDHGGPGPSPFTGYSWWRYALDEETYLKHVLKLDESELAAYREERDSRQCMT